MQDVPAVDKRGAAGMSSLLVKRACRTLQAPRCRYITSWMENFDSPGAYLEALHSRSRLPEGFHVGVTNITFAPAERPSDKPYSMNLSLLLLDEPSPSFAGVFTRNSFCGHPVAHARSRLSMPVTRGVCVNTKIANVGSVGGDHDILRIVRALAESTNADPGDFFSASTGIVGWKLPIDEMERAIPELVRLTTLATMDQFARGIMTTDRFPKVRSVSIGQGSIVAAAKGAGMIEPNMRTMLAFVVTDIDIDRRELQACLERVARRTFNRISVDGDQSTSDMLLAFSSRRKPSVTGEQFESALLRVCAALAEDIVRNGEGTSHVIRVKVEGAAAEEEALRVGKAVVNSPLVKTAIYGNDPNVGRILAAIGDDMGNHDADLDLSKVTLKLGELEIFRGGRFHLDFQTESRLSDYLKSARLDPSMAGFPAHDRTVDISCDLGRGRNSAEVIGSDLSHEYVRENADYRS